MMDKRNQKKKWQDYSGYKIAEKLMAEGYALKLFQQSVLPVLEVRVKILEKSRDSLGDVEQFILKLVEADVGNVAAMSELLGIRKHRLAPILRELDGRGLIRVTNNDRINLTHLGKLSLEAGCEVLCVERALLLCGVTGKLLPKPFYDVERFTAHELPRCSFNKKLIDESQIVPLADLNNIKTLENKRAYNLPDEVMEVTEVIGSQPRFVQGALVIYNAESASSDVCEFHCDRSVIDWIPVSKIVDSIAPLEWPTPKDGEESVAEKIVAELEELGFGVSSQPDLDKYGNPHVHVTVRDDKCLSSSDGGFQTLITRLGTETLDPIPLLRFPIIRRDLLKGHPLYLYAEEKDVSEKVKIIREINSAFDDFYSVPFSKRKGTIDTHIREVLIDKGIIFSVAEEIVKKFGSNRHKKGFDSIHAE